jgi:hypothetical protein
MTIQLKSVFLSAALAAMILPVAAQNSSTTTPGSAVTPPSTVTTPPSTVGNPPSTQKPPTAQKPPSAQKPPVSAAKRESNQQTRIGHGIQDGELTPEEASRLEKQEGQIKKETEAARADGTVTAAEKAKVQRQQNELSHEINDQKHDAQKMQNPPADGRVATRKENQQDRIGKGVANGSISPEEASKLENQENHINQETKQLRENNDGKLTEAQRKQLNHQQQKVSKNIHHAKTNGNGGKGR